MKRHNTRAALALFSILATILACNLPGSTTGTATEPPALQDTPVVSTQTTSTETSPSSPPADVSPTEAAIQHQAVPVSLPEKQSSHAGDYDSSVTASKKSANGGDRFTFERFERPFNANTMDVYFPNLDIVDTFVYQDEMWIYGSIQVKDRTAAKSSPYNFALQLDTDIDGKGDWLILATNPPSSDWTVNGVQVFQDANNDVGNHTAMHTDDNAIGDGFESKVFDQGAGNDPDAAWIRVSPKDANLVEIAVKRSFIGDPAKYLIDTWAGSASLDPALFDFSDHFTHTDAGTADSGLKNFYPIKSLAELDNSCRMAVGFQPTGLEPGLCKELSPIDEAGPTACVRPASCYGCSKIWDPIKCTCTDSPC